MASPVSIKTPRGLEAHTRYPAGLPAPHRSVPLRSVSRGTSSQMARNAQYEPSL